MTQLEYTARPLAESAMQFECPLLEKKSIGNSPNECFTL